MELKTLILSAGKGTRMKSEIPKVLHKVNGKPMIVKILETLDTLNPTENILILGHKKDEILEVVGNISYVVQEQQLGTGDAIKSAYNKLKDYNGDILVICGDTPLITQDTLQKFYDYHKENKATTTILTSIYENPTGYGRIVKDKNGVKAIIEEKEASPEIKKIREVNGGIYLFDSQELFKALSQINNNNEKGEYYLTDVIGIQVEENKKVESFMADKIEILGVNSKVELAQASYELRHRKNLSLMEDGVILIDPNNTYIDEDVVIDIDTIIYPNVFLVGNTKIGKNCEILAGTRIVDSVVANNVRIENSVIEESQIDSGVTIGPYAHIRPKSHLMEDVHIGNFVETKKSTLHKGVKSGHLTYLGDAVVGEYTNIGAGTITCNYDGTNKFKTNIGKKVFIGSDTMLVAPVNVGNNATVGAGSVITKDVPDKALAVSRSKQIIKDNWRK